ncbi:MAG: hypothetical protein JWQ53_1983 [Klenkia sp.]|nr:hypothetical protein [Klenkia sp.]
MGTQNLQTPTSGGVVGVCGTPVAVRLRAPMTGLPVGTPVIATALSTTALSTTPGSPPWRVPPS